MASQASAKTEQLTIKSIRGPGSPDLGTFRVAGELFGWKNSVTSEVIQLDSKLVEGIEWWRINSREFLLRFLTTSRVDFTGFREHDFEPLNSYFKRHWKMPISADTNFGMKGWHWGKWSLSNKSFCFEVDGKRAVEVPLNKLANVTTTKTEISLELKQKEKQLASEDIITEIRFCAPPPPKEDDGLDTIEFVKTSILDASGLGELENSATVCRFSYKNCLQPPGRFDIQFQLNSVRLHGKSFDYRVQFNNIIDVYILHDDQSSKLLLTLVNPLKKGNTKYPAVIVCLDDKQEQTLTINASSELQEEIKQFLPTLQTPEMTIMENLLAGPLLQALAKKKILGTTSFKGATGLPSFPCSYKVQTGWFYPLENEFVYLAKPVIAVKYSDVSSVNLGRTQGQQTRLFEFSITLKSGAEYEFNQVDRQELQPFVDFVNTQGLKMREMVTESREDHDSHHQRPQEVDDDDDSEDEDFEDDEDDEDDDEDDEDEEDDDEE